MDLSNVGVGLHKLKMKQRRKPKVRQQLMQYSDDPAVFDHNEMTHVTEIGSSSNYSDVNRSFDEDQHVMTPVPVELEQ